MGKESSDNDRVGMGCYVSQKKGGWERKAVTMMGWEECGDKDEMVRQTNKNNSK